MVKSAGGPEVSATRLSSLVYDEQDKNALSQTVSAYMVKTSYRKGKRDSGGNSKPVPTSRETCQKLIREIDLGRAPLTCRV